MDKLILEEQMLPMVPLRGLTILPGAIIHFDVKRQRSIAAVEQAITSGSRLFLVSQINDEEAPALGDLYQVGVLANVRQIMKLQGKTIRVLVEAVSRAVLHNISLHEEENRKSWLQASIVEVAPEQDALFEKEHPIEAEAMMRRMKESFGAYAALHPGMGAAVARKYDLDKSPAVLIDQITMNIPIDISDKQRVLDETELPNRFQVFSVILENETEIARMKADLSKKIKERVEQNQKEYLLKEQLRFIREELGDNDPYSDEEQFQKKLEELQASDEVKEKITKEISRLSKLAPSSSESSVERSYIETLLELPWDKTSMDSESLQRAKEILDQDHYGLAKVKERIQEFLAVRTLTKKGDSTILCLVGPPGTGKTSIAQSVARALDKKYVRISLGGVRDEAEIRGHRKTYVGAMPGRLVSGLIQAQVKNPLMLLDEIDKVSNDYKGDTFSALLEVLDSEQNVRFRDHYVEIPIDLSEVLFIATANTTDTIPRPLLDRMEVIEVTSYTENEKFHIAKEHLLKKELEKNGLTKKELVIRDSALKHMITYYTREAGVRSLQRTIGEVCRKAAKEILEKQEAGEEPEKLVVSSTNLEQYLGKKKYRPDKAAKKAEVGIVRGLAWTSVGGVTLQIEVNKMPGKATIDLTGQMGDVMKESAVIAMSYVRSIAGSYQVDEKVFQENDFHIHIPEGAVPKDGPSAGVTMATAIFSAVTGKKVRCDVAMTGEVTLRGRVLPIGGLKEKLLVAKMAGIREVFVPLENKKDAEEISEEIKEGLTLTFVSDMKEILAKAIV